ncbi:MAG: hypothetical protein PHH73_00090 [Candidatus Rickettsiella isopodorum]|nr:hypothetical protein [Candidatus Rickettsiella isopodorum]
MQQKDLGLYLDLQFHDLVRYLTKFNKNSDTELKKIGNNILSLDAYNVTTVSRNNLNLGNVQENLWELDDEKISRMGTHPVKYRTFDTGNWFMDDSYLAFCSSNSYVPLYSLDMWYKNLRIRNNIDYEMKYTGGSLTNQSLTGSGLATLTPFTLSLVGSAASISLTAIAPNLTMSSTDANFNPSYISIQGETIKNKGDGFGDDFIFSAGLSMNGGSGLIGGNNQAGWNPWTEINGTTMGTTNLIFRNASNYFRSPSISLTGVDGDNNRFLQITPRMNYSGIGDDYHFLLSSSMTAISNGYGRISLSTAACEISTHTYIIGNEVVTGTVTAGAFSGVISSAIYSSNSDLLDLQHGSYYAVKSEVAASTEALYYTTTDYVYTYDFYITTGSILWELWHSTGTDTPSGFVANATTTFNMQGYNETNVSTISMTGYSPEIKLTDSANNYYSRWRRSNGTNKSAMYNQVTCNYYDGGYEVGFDGSNDYVELNSSDISKALDGGTTIAIMCWICPNALPTTSSQCVVQLFNRGNSGGWDAFAMDTSSGQILVGAGSIYSEYALKWNKYGSRTALSIGTTSQIATILDFGGKVIYTYVNGVLYSSVTAVTWGNNTWTHSNVWDASVPSYGLGKGTSYSGGAVYSGSIDEFCIYKSTNLGDAQTRIIEHYNAGVGKKMTNENGLISGYHLDEGIGTIAYDFGSYAATGTLKNSPSWNRPGFVPIVLGNSQYETTVWKSEDSGVYNSSGTNTFGDPLSITNIKGSAVNIDNFTVTSNLDYGGYNATNIGTVSVGTMSVTNNETVTTSGASILPSININDSRTGATAVTGAALRVNATGSGAYALSIPNGNVDISGTNTYLRGNIYYSGSLITAGGSIPMGWGSTVARFRGYYDDGNGAGDQQMCFKFNDIASGRSSAINFMRDLELSNDGSRNGYLSPTFVLYNDEGADANDYSAVEIGEHYQSNVANIHYFDFYATTGTVDGSENVTTAEKKAVFRFGSTRSSSPTYATNGGDVYFSGQVEISSRVVVSSIIITGDVIIPPKFMIKDPSGTNIMDYDQVGTPGGWTLSDKLGSGRIEIGSNGTYIYGENTPTGQQEINIDPDTGISFKDIPGNTRLRVSTEGARVEINTEIQVIANPIDTYIATFSTSTDGNFAVAISTLGGLLSNKTKPFVSVYLNGDLTMDVPSSQQISYNTIIKDNLGEFTLTGSSYVCTYTGWYNYNIGSWVSGSNSGVITQYTRINGITNRTVYIYKTASREAVPISTGRVHLNAGDKFDVVITNVSPGATVTLKGTVDTYFEIEWDSQLNGD